MHHIRAWDWSVIRMWMLANGDWGQLLWRLSSVPFTVTLTWLRHWEVGWRVIWKIWVCLPFRGSWVRKCRHWHKSMSGWWDVCDRGCRAERGNSVLGEASSRGGGIGSKPNDHYTSVGFGPFLKMYLWEVKHGTATGRNIPSQVKPRNIVLWHLSLTLKAVIWCEPVSWTEWLLTWPFLLKSVAACWVSSMFWN